MNTKELDSNSKRLRGNQSFAQSPSECRLVSTEKVILFLERVKVLAEQEKKRKEQNLT